MLDLESESSVQVKVSFAYVWGHEGRRYMHTSWFQTRYPLVPNKISVCSGFYSVRHGKSNRKRSLGDTYTRRRRTQLVFSNPRYTLNNLAKPGQQGLLHLHPFLESNPIKIWRGRITVMWKGSFGGFRMCSEGLGSNRFPTQEALFEIDMSTNSWLGIYALSLRNLNLHNHHVEDESSFRMHIFPQFRGPQTSQFITSVMFVFWSKCLINWIVSWCCELWYDPK